MKRLITLFAQIMLGILAVNAQLYLKAYTGYSLSLNMDKNISREIVNTIENDYAFTYKHGEGMNLGIAVGYQINKNLSVEANCNTQLFTNQKITIPSSIDYASTTQSFYFSGFFGSLNYSHQIIQLSPQLMYRVNYHKINLYIKTGPNFLNARSYISDYYKEFILSETHWGFDFKDAASKRYLEGKWSIGLQSSVGIEYPISSKMTLFGELLSINGNFLFNKSILQSYEIEGVSQINEGTQTTFDLSSEKKCDFSQIGLNVGIKYTF